jgi:hypothetical protein
MVQRAAHMSTRAQGRYLFRQVGLVELSVCLYDYELYGGGGQLRSREKHDEIRIDSEHNDFLTSLAE